MNRFWFTASMIVGFGICLYSANHYNKVGWMIFFAGLIVGSLLWLGYLTWTGIVGWIRSIETEK